MAAEERIGSIPLADALRPWLADAPAYEARVSPAALQLSAEQSMVLKKTLLQLRASHEHLSGERRVVEGFSECLMDIVVAMQEDSDLKALMLATMESMLTSCADRRSRGMNDLYVALLTHRAERADNPTVELCKLGEQLARLEAVHRIAYQHAGGDAVERYFALETHVASEIELPLWSAKLRYGSFARVNKDEKEAALQAARDVGLAQVEAYLASWAPWQRHRRSVDVATLSYHGLPVVPFDNAEATCSITLEKVGALQQPVLTRDQRRVYEYAALTQWYIAQGTDPDTRERMALAG